jgi:hypothetical protein
MSKAKSALVCSRSKIHNSFILVIKEEYYV